MDPEIVILSEVSRTEKEKYHMTPLICGIQKEMIQMNLTYKTKTNSQTWKMNILLLGEGTVRDFGKVMYTLLYLKWITNEDLMYDTWNSTQSYVPV